MGKLIWSHRELGLEASVRGVDGDLRAFQELSKSFPKQETYSLTDQIRRASRSVTTNITEAWRKRRYAAAFVSKLNDAEAEAAETQDWLHYAVECGYIERLAARRLFKEYDHILATLVGMITYADTWVFPQASIVIRRARARAAQ